MNIKQLALIVSALTLSLTITHTAQAEESMRDANTVAIAALKANNCASCHGVDYIKSSDDSIPSLAGQHEDYLVQALRQYRAGDSKRATLSRNNGIMTGNAKKLSDAEIKDIAAYLSRIQGKLSIPKPPKGLEY
jgi:cytochrome c553